MAFTPYTVEKEINGKKYIAQFNGLSFAQETIDKCYIDDSRNISTSKLTKQLFEHVIVDPKGLTADDFDTMDELSEVTDFAGGVMRGDFRDKAVKTAAPKKG